MDTGCRCSGTCPCHARAIGRALGREPNRDAWRPQHDDAIRVLVATGMCPAEIAATLSSRFAIPRTAGAVRVRMTRLGVSSRDGWLSRYEVGVLLGVGRKMMETWDAQGLLPSHEFARWRRLKTADVEAFVVAHAGTLFDPRRVRDARLRSLAETSAIVNRRRMAS